MNQDSVRKIETLQSQIEKISFESGFSVVVQEKAGLEGVIEANNNSICEVLMASREFRPECEKFCGRAFDATRDEKGNEFKCHAGLQCKVVRINKPNAKKLVAINGRAFTKTDDYKRATERAISGDWRGLAVNRLFENILIASSNERISSVAEKISRIGIDIAEEPTRIEGRQDTQTKAKPERPAPAKSEISESSLIEITKPNESLRAEKPALPERDSSLNQRSAPPDFVQNSSLNAPIKDRSIKARPKRIERPSVPFETGSSIEGKSDHFARQNETIQVPRLSNPAKVAEKNPDIDSQFYMADTKETASWRRLFASFNFQSYSNSCRRIVEFVSKRYQIESVAWLENKDNYLRLEYGLGAFETQKIEISLSTEDEKFKKLFSKRSSVALRKKTEKGATKSVRLFPIGFGGEIRDALVIGERGDEIKIRRSMIRFCQLAASELEVVRLRERIDSHKAAVDAIKKVNRHLGNIDSEEFWAELLDTVGELVGAERGSLLVLDPQEKCLTIRAAFGNRAKALWEIQDGIGSRIALKVWEKGKPLLLKSVKESPLTKAPKGWQYKTDSFICYPLSSGNRLVGILNLTDKKESGRFDSNDLTILDSIAPQLAVAIDRHEMKDKAGEFEQLSVTDPLTGLLNRRYLAERLNEEIRRSDRHGYPMSFVMLDVDHFKSYNDKFSHPEGDKALQIVAQCIKESLREADVAARYGGEEFSILLPQTNLEEGRIIAERIRARIENTRFAHRQVTVSIGITGASSTRNTATEVISAADKALFEAKRKGRNRVCIFEYERKNMPVGE